MRPIVRAELVFVRFSNTGNQGDTQRFPDTPSLNGAGVRVLGIEAFTDAQLLQTPDGSPCLPAAEVDRVVVTLAEGSDQRYKQMPLSSLVAQLNAGVWKEFSPLQMDFQKSQVELVGSITAGSSVPFVFYYALVV